MSVLNWVMVALIPGLIGYPVLLDSYGEERLPYKGTWVDYPIYISRALIFSILWPMIVLFLIIEKKMDKTQSRKSTSHKRKDLITSKSQNNDKLSFIKMGGKGFIFCDDCYYKQDLVGLLHGFSEVSWTQGYQCQACGKFHEIRYDYRLDKIPKCGCGGILSHEKPLFCPACKSFKVSYFMTKIT